jgi:amino-acid N-acetyltransferase
VEGLLNFAELPLAGLREQFPGAYVVARDQHGIVGVAGLERYGDAGLLRSLAVVPAQRRTGLGRRLVTDRLAHARDARLGAVYLLTTTASEYFPRLGFVPASRSDVPAALAASEEFARACPASAACFVRRIAT